MAARSNLVSIVLSVMVVVEEPAVEVLVA